MITFARGTGSSVPVINRCSSASSSWWTSETVLGRRERLEVEAHPSIISLSFLIGASSPSLEVGDAITGPIRSDTAAGLRVPGTHE